MSEDPKPGPLFRRSKRVSLRVITKDNIPKYLEWFNDPEVTQYTSGIFPVSEEEETEWVQNLSKRKQTDVMFAIWTNDGRLIGNMGLHRINYVDGTAVTGAVIGEKDFWGKGLGMEAKMLLLEWAFNTLNLRKINSHVLGFNKRSQRYSEKCGYKIEAVLKDQMFRNGKYEDMVIMSVFKTDWLLLWEKFRVTL
ncbi:MAG: GNAT family protein [Candidatus Liptonbacteria bacterium]|nr:GNAT family protein [Candidatus Liptonbacteria bacterium]